MGVIETPSTEVLATADADAGLALSREAGWNQTAEDWRFFLRRGTVFGTRDTHGRVVATAAILPYGSNAWISLVLVSPPWRRRGLATRLMVRCLEQADRVGLRTWLDATPAGAEVYRQLGFAPAGELMRLRRPASSVGSGGREGRGGAADATAHLLAFDRDALGLDRSGPLAELAGRVGGAAMGDVEACCLVREGDRARHIGPVYGRSPRVVAGLFARVAATEPGELVIDAYAHQMQAMAELARLGFAGERPFIRMTRGGDAPLPSPLAFASAGPEYG